MDLKWTDDFTIKFSVMAETGVISADRNGLLSLAEHLKALAEESAGSHIHLDRYNSLEEGSAELIIEKLE